MMRIVLLGKRINPTAMLAIIGLICSDTLPSRAADTGTIVKRAPIEALRSPDRPVGEQMPLTTANVPVAEDRVQASVDRGNPLWVVPLTSLTATLQRPIFSPTRRPPPLPLPPQITIAPSIDLGRPNFSLVGAISGEHEDIAILLDETTKVIIRLRTGESHSGWTLQMANGREVTLQKNSKTAVLSLPNPPTK